MDILTISSGNTKIEEMPNISLTPIISCRPNTPCQTKCYALRPYNRYPTVKKAWDKNFALLKKDPEFYFKYIEYWLEANSTPFFRWHVGGEILDQWYLEGMIKIALTNPKTSFVVYTKNYGLDYNNTPSNLHVFFSLWLGIKIPERSKNVNFAWIDKMNPPQNVFRCRTGACSSCGRYCYMGKGDVVFTLR